jgi:hypothetical protein
MAYKTLIYRLLVDATILLHFLWILFLLVGIVFALKKSKLAWLHLGGLLISLVLNIYGWYCPLTYLENHLRSSRLSSGTYEGSFIAHHVEKVIYPDVPERIIRTGGILFVGLNLVVYAILVRRYFLTTQIQSFKVHGSRFKVRNR